MSLPLYNVYIDRKVSKGLILNINYFFFWVEKPKKQTNKKFIRMNISGRIEIRVYRVSRL